MSDDDRIIDGWIEMIEEKLDEEDPEGALALAEEALAEYPDAPDFLALRGDALWSLGDIRASSETYELAVKILPDAADLLAGLARIRFSLCDFFGARRFAKEALKYEERVEALDVLGRLAERSGRMNEADRYAARAAALDDEAYPRPLRVVEGEFREAAEKAIDLLPERFRAAVRDGNVALLVEPFPAEEILLEEEPPFDPAILGLYLGIPLPERTADAQRMPDTIHLFWHNIERVSRDRETLIREIALTVYHELGHFFGLDEDELEELDLA